MHARIPAIFGRLPAGGALLLFLLATLLAAAVPERFADRWPPENYLVYYGGWDDNKLEQAHEFDLVILHPGRNIDNISAFQLKKLKYGRDEEPGTGDDVMVIVYITIGEDESVPRGPSPRLADGETLPAGPVYHDAEQGIVQTGHGYPTYYLDHLTYRFNENGFYDWQENGMPATELGHDGLPDENGKWNSYFVHAGDASWQTHIFARMEALKTRLDPDGFFLDTLDTASPWGNYGWMQEDMSRLIHRIRQQAPEHLIIGNRGLFLLDKYADLVRPSLDGLMFESFISEWDWYRNLGVDHQWLQSNNYVLRNSVLPQARRDDGFLLFFLNYVSPYQPDYLNFLATQHQLLADVPHVSYISSPDLAKIYGPVETYLERYELAQLPTLADFSVTEIEKGRFAATWLLSAIEGDVPTFGKQLYLDLRYSTKPLPAGQLPFAQRVVIDYDRLEQERLDDGRLRLRYASYGLDRFQQYFFSSRLIGPRPEQVSELKQSVCETTAGAWSGLLEGIKAEGLEQRIRLTWDRPKDRQLAGYQIYLGGTHYDLEVIQSIDSPETTSAILPDLENRRGYYVTVAGVRGGGEVGNLAYPLLAFPKDCEPPPPPKHLGVVPSIKHTFYVKWQPPEATDLAGYRVYCFEADQKLRYPLKVGAGTNELLIEDLTPGKTYKVFVTSVDFDNNQSQPAELKEVVAK